MNLPRPFPCQDVSLYLHQKPALLFSSMGLCVILLSEAEIKHVHELLQLMAVMTQDDRFENVYSPDMERRGMTMCEVLDRVESRGIEKGITQGEDKILALMNYLLRNNRAEDAKKATEDKSYRNKLLAEVFGDGQ